MDLVSQIMVYESDELSDEETIELFSMLVKDGMVWSLQGHYGRIARKLIDVGVLNESGEINYDQIIELMMENK